MSDPEPNDAEPGDAEPVDAEPVDAEPGDDDVAAAGARAVLEYLARSVVDDPDGVDVEVDATSSRVTLEVTVTPGDMGRVIGKRGRTANAIRTVVRAAAVNDDVEVDVEFVE
ncbi:hypothetical protein BH24ACT3_BH24ACT3_05060 [soil metagenome]